MLATPAVDHVVDLGPCDTMTEPKPRVRKRDLPRTERVAMAREKRGAERVRLFVSCAPGLEPLLAAEVSALNIGKPTRVPGGVELDADRRGLYRANLELGLALQVRARIGRFRTMHFAELVRRVAELPWERWLAVGARVRFRSVAQRSRLHHTGAIDERVAEGIAARLGGAVIAAGGDEECALVHARFDRDEAVLSIDTSGAPLHRRGWRLATAKAPMREDLARALVLTSGWNRTSPLVDPMAGSGTVAIEAALLARNVAPGRQRRFAFQDAPSFDPALFASVVADADARSVSSLSFPILARDRDAGAVAAARGNAERAGVTLEHQVAALSDPLPEAFVASEEGALVTNPPWGVRVGSDRDLRPLYQRLAATIAALPPRWSAAVAAADAELVRRVGWPLHSALLTDAGGTKVRFYVRDRSDDVTP